MKSLPAVIGSAALAICGATAAVACPDWSGAPHFGAIQLSAGFTPDPYVQSVTAGGTHDLAGCGLQAAGFVTVRPDFDLYWSGSSAQLTIAVQSAADAVILVSMPDGSYYYSDDYNGTDPAVIIQNPPEGLYDIWIGSYDGSRRNPAQLIITELPY